MVVAAASDDDELRAGGDDVGDPDCLYGPLLSVNLASPGPSAPKLRSVEVHPARAEVCEKRLPWWSRPVAGRPVITKERDDRLPDLATYQSSS